jgi:hypothetical protein
LVFVFFTPCVHAHGAPLSVNAFSHSKHPAVDASFANFMVLLSLRHNNCPLKYDREAEVVLNIYFGTDNCHLYNCYLGVSGLSIGQALFPLFLTLHAEPCHTMGSNAGDANFGIPVGSDVFEGMDKKKLTKLIFPSLG